MSFKSVISSFILTMFLMRRVLANSAVTQSDTNGLPISLQHSPDVENTDMIIFFAVFTVGMTIISVIIVYIYRKGYCKKVERSDSSSDPSSPPAIVQIAPPPTSFQLGPPPIINNYPGSSAPPLGQYNPHGEHPPSYFATVQGDLISATNPQYH